MDFNDRERFGDIWFRARHNALANEVASGQYKFRLYCIDFLLAALIVAPLASSLLAKEQLINAKLGIFISVLGTFGALLLSLVGIFREWRVSYNNHCRAHSVFNNIAQKARRGENELNKDEVHYLLRSLEEMFETAKFNFSEPSDKSYNKGLQRMANMPKWPFDLDVEAYRKIRNTWIAFDLVKYRKKMKKEIDIVEKECVLAKSRIYDTYRFEEVHENWIKGVSFEEKKVLDIGCGSGRDASYMSSKGATVIGVDKSPHFIEICENKSSCENILFIQDELPTLKKVKKRKEKFDLILLSAVLMFLNEEKQLESIKTITKLINESGIIIITFKNNIEDKSIYPFNSKVLEWLRCEMFKVTELDGGEDSFQRKNVSWKVYKIKKQN